MIILMFYKIYRLFIRTNIWTSLAFYKLNKTRPLIRVTNSLFGALINLIKRIKQQPLF